MRRESGLLRFARQFTHFFATILWVGAALASAAEAFGPGEDMARLGVAIVGVILLNGVFSFWQEHRAERAVAALLQQLPQQVKALRDGKVHQLVSRNLLPGDVVRLDEGDVMPADCRLIEGFGLRINASTITGKSLPKARNAEPSMEPSALRARNISLAATMWLAEETRKAWLWRRAAAAPERGRLRGRRAAGHRCRSPGPAPFPSPPRHPYPRHAPARAGRRSAASAGAIQNSLQPVQASSDAT